MSREITGPYDPKTTEKRIYALWLESGYFNPDNLPNKKGKKFSIVIPPPNITGPLHMGHALNAVIQDVLIRKKRMEGYKTLWLPGTDHAGIATQNVVEKNLLKTEGKTRHEIGKEKFAKLVWQWKEKYGNEILNQLKQLGSSCDWSRVRFTMDEDYQKEVQNAFMHYYDKGWIYRAEKVVNWCPKCQTSLSDLELEYKEEKTFLWHIKYPLVETPEKFIVVATTRPETMLGDTAVAVSPKDERYKNLVGKKTILPLVNKKIPIIADRRVEAGFGTGAVKVTPAHSLIDAEIGEEHKIPAPKVIGTSGKMRLDPEISKTEAAKYDGLAIKEAREQIVKDLKLKGFLEKTENYVHNIALCYRCSSVIENLPSLQWFLKMDELAKKAIEAVEKGRVKFYPARWEKIYFDWLRSIKDWCISRQIWWGHKIPIDGVDDVLDTWFSSALWPFATMKGKDRELFYPTDVLSTARDIINLWVSRMIFSGLEFTKKPPFKAVIIHPTILTKEGKRMSKSLGTGLDPLKYIETYGADATRFGLIWQTMGNQDIHWSEEHVLAGKKFLNKIWNAARFVLSAQTEPSAVALAKADYNKLTDADKEILKKLEEIVKKTTKQIETYQFGQALHDLYDFFWHDFCDKYLEISKTQSQNALLKENTQKILIKILIDSVKLLHPFLPHLTEEIWSKIKSGRDNSLIVTPWPVK